MADAMAEALRLGHGVVGGAHLLVALAREEGTPAARLLSSSGFSVAAARVELVRATRSVTRTSPPAFSPEVRAAVDEAGRRTRTARQTVATAHLLAGILSAGGRSSVDLLERLGVAVDRLSAAAGDLIAGTGSGNGGDPGGSGGSGAEGTGSEQIPSARRGPMPVICSFCSRPAPAAGRLLSGPSAVICEACVERAERLLAKPASEPAPLRRISSGAPVPYGPNDSPPGSETGGGGDPAGPAPASGEAGIISMIGGAVAGARSQEAVEARRSIEAAFSRMLTPGPEGRALPAVEGGEDLAGVLAVARARAPSVFGAVSDVRVERTVIGDDDRAAVWFTLLSGDRPLGVVANARKGGAVREAGVWKVDRSTFCGLVGLVGVDCPPLPGS